MKTFLSSGTGKLIAYGFGTFLCSAFLFLTGGVFSLQADDASVVGHVSSEFMEPPKWDYLIKKENELNPAGDIAAALTTLGQEGWELCAITPTARWSSKDGDILTPPLSYIFKRPHKNH